jgi:ceramide glucosyltransferase
MELHHWLGVAAALPPLLVSLLVLRNYRYAMRTRRKARRSYRPRALVVVPCKGLDTNFHQNVRSFFQQDYEDYLLWFVVGNESDPAYRVLCELKQQHTAESKARQVQILIAGDAQKCGQKTHNMLYACQRVDPTVEVLAFADADAAAHTDWLRQIVHPLRRSKNGAVTGYRWFVPKTNNIASMALSAVNGKVAQLMGNTRFNLAWGGSMAIRVNVFRKLGLDEIWPRTVSDDLALSHAIRKAGMKIVFVPSCLAPSLEQMTWSQLFEFAQRQFVVTRIGAPGTWWIGLCGNLYLVLGLWGTAAATLFSQQRLFFGMLFAIFLLSDLARAIVRQRMAANLLAEYRDRMRPARIADMAFFWAWSILLLVFIVSSAFRRTITWRGIKYRVVSLTETTVVASDAGAGETSN